MKNNLNIISIIFFISLFLLNLNKSLASEVVINASEVDIQEEGNLILAYGSVSITDGNNIEIKGEKAKYNKLDQNIEIIGDVIFLDKGNNYKAKSNKVIFDREKNLIYSYEESYIYIFDENNINTNFEIKSEDLIIDQNNQTIEFISNIFAKDIKQDYVINADKIIYFKPEEIIKSFGKTKIDYRNQISIETKDLIYNKNKKNFVTSNKTVVQDNFSNIFELSGFDFDLEKNTFKAKELKITDRDNNLLEFSNGYVDLNINELVGSDFNFKFNKNLFGNTENDPRLIGNYAIINESETNMKKASFTTCKNSPGKCPAWSISANEVRHSKEKKIIEYKKAWLEIYDVPVAYFPYFFHPDPSVKRQSGFLFPQFVNSSNLGFSSQIPYYNVIDIDRDITIAPRVYTNNNLFVQTEYRQSFKDSNLITDFSYNKKGKSNGHFFSSLIGDLENSFYEMKIETVTNNDYLKKYQIKSPLINNYSYLNSSVTFETFDDDFNFVSSFNIFEDLSKKESDKYEFVIPTYQFNKEYFLNNNIFDALNFKSDGNYRKYNTNVDEAEIINDLIFTSTDQNNNFHIETDFNLLLRNINTYGNLSEKYKEDKNYNLLSSIIYNVKYPLLKENNFGKEFLTPIASIRFSPNSGTNLINEKNQVNFNDLFEIDRINNNTVESGLATTIGLEYKNQNKLNNDKAKIGLAINFRTKEDKDIPLSSSLGNKTSDIIGYSGVNITENLYADYNFSIDQNLQGTNYSLASINYNNDKFKMSFGYMEKSNFVGDESYLSNKTEVRFDKSNLISFETNKNLDKNITDYYNLIYNYRNDCLEASIVYNKQFYQDDDVAPDKNIYFKLSFIPFANINGPNLNE